MDLFHEDECECDRYREAMNEFRDKYEMATRAKDLEWNKAIDAAAATVRSVSCAREDLDIEASRRREHHLMRKCLT
jgi:hypothetical protein